MSILKPDLEVIIDNKGPFKPGDFINGTVVVKNSSELQVQNIDVMLRCTEMTHTSYFSGFALTLYWNEVFNRNRVCSFRETLYPPQYTKSGLEPPIFWGTRQPKPHNSWNDDFDGTSVIMPGTHTYAFVLEVPLGFPPSIAASFSNNLVWNVTAKVFKSGLLSVAREKSVVIEVHGGDSITLSPDDIETKEKPFPVVAYSASGAKQEKIVKLEVSFHRNGLVLAPNRIGIHINIGGDYVEDLMLTGVELQLKQKVETSVVPLRRLSSRRKWQERHDIFRSKETVYSRALHLPYEVGLDSVNEDLRKTKIDKILVESFQSRCFEVTYKLVAIVTVVSAERPSNKQKLRVSVPIKVNSPLAKVRQLDSAPDFLPEYAE